jgi:hypothetical protein
VCAKRSRAPSRALRNRRAIWVCEAAMPAARTSAGRGGLAGASREREDRVQAPAPAESVIAKGADNPLHGSATRVLSPRRPLISCARRALLGWVRWCAPNTRRTRAERPRAICVRLEGVQTPGARDRRCMCVRVRISSRSETQCCSVKRNDSRENNAYRTF